jgi:hypothetical protein
MADSHASSNAKGDSISPDDEDDSELELLLELFDNLIAVRCFCIQRYYYRPYCVSKAAINSC